MKSKTPLRLVYKINTRKLKKNNWELTLPLSQAMTESPDDIIALGDSQCFRFIDSIRGIEDRSEQIGRLKSAIRKEKKNAGSRLQKQRIKNLYEKLYELQFTQDYVNIVMDSVNDYDRANKGFMINGIKYRRLLGTNGGIKHSTITYVNEEIYDELKEKLDNGRNREKKLVPAKLEAYNALICSGSTVLPQPKGIIVVKDCVTKFKENVIMLDDSCDGEPSMKVVNDYEVEHDDSDGFGLMLPSYARRVNMYLNDTDEPLTGMNTRYAWTKGMVVTFDYIEFANSVAGNYMIRDVWGDMRDVRDSEVILTESMVKLWDSYSSWEDYKSNCDKYGYLFSTPKICPHELENTRNTNYQFVQSYKLDDDDLYELCKPTINEINDALGLDYRKSLAYLCGSSLNDDNCFSDSTDHYVKALMIEPRMINDPYVRRKIYHMISKRIMMAKRGAVMIEGNFAMIVGDPYALCQSIFGLEVTGLLKKGEIYHKYWSDKGSAEVVCFRAPMTCHNNIRKARLRYTDDVRYWYRYIKTAICLNAWDTMCDAMNGADKDGDTFMVTDNPVLIKNTRELPAIFCVQRRAEKVVPTEELIIASNKLAFNDEIGIVTNHVTSFFDKQAEFDEGSDEYKEIDYRIMCGQLYQQNTIDRAKGVIAKSMPEYWYNRHAVRQLEESEHKNMCESIVAPHKPYFMAYVYPSLKTKDMKYKKVNDMKSIFRFGKGVDELEDTVPEEYEQKRFYERGISLGKNPCTVNRICWLFEREFSGFREDAFGIKAFDPNILKSGVEYSKSTYSKIKDVYEEYKIKTAKVLKEINDNPDDYNGALRKQLYLEIFAVKCHQICPNEDMLCDILIDMCYRSDNSKSFVWEICGDVIISNMLDRSKGKVSYPALACGDDYDFAFNGKKYIMREKTIERDNIE